MKFEMNEYDQACVPGSIKPGHRPIIVEEFEADLMAAEIILQNPSVIHISDVLHNAWECDPTVWVLEEENGKRHILTTDHGGYRIVNRDWVKAQLKYYATVMADTEKILELI